MMGIFPDVNKIIGKGEHAVVFEGTCNYPLKVAVKRVLLKDVESRPHSEEENALLKLQHPNVVRIFQAESDLEYR